MNIVLLVARSSIFTDRPPPSIASLPKNLQFLILMTFLEAVPFNDSERPPPRPNDCKLGPLSVLYVIGASGGDKNALLDSNEQFKMV